MATICVSACDFKKNKNRLHGGFFLCNWYGWYIIFCMSWVYKPASKILMGLTMIILINCYEKTIRAGGLFSVFLSESVMEPFIGAMNINFDRSDKVTIFGETTLPQYHPSKEYGILDFKRIMKKSIDETGGVAGCYELEEIGDPSAILHGDLIGIPFNCNDGLGETIIFFELGVTQSSIKGRTKISLKPINSLVEKEKVFNIKNLDISKLFSLDKKIVKLVKIDEDSLFNEIKKISENLL